MDIQEVEAFRAHTLNKTTQWKREFPAPWLNSLAAALAPFVPQAASQQEIAAKQGVLARLTQCLESAITNPPVLRQRPVALQMLTSWQLCDFGSTAMGVSLAGGDLDISLEGEMVVRSKKGNPKPVSKKDKMDLLRDVHRVFMASGMLRAGELVTRARVPVSKFVDRGSCVHCDLSIRNTTGVLKSHLMYMVRYRMAPALQG